MNLPLHAKTEPNRTGMPDRLKAGIESLSGMDMSDVRVHPNSEKPGQLYALAYAQGHDIHLAPGQEQHLPHEAWHLVQQKLGRVRPTLQVKGLAINDNEGLEREADVMGGKAFQGIAQREKNNSEVTSTLTDSLKASRSIVQRAWIGRRPLAGLVGIGMSGEHPKGHGGFHEHIIFEDGREPQNIGFGPNGLFTENIGANYMVHKNDLNDLYMRNAVKSQSLPGGYDALNNNCQIWVQKVMKIYNNLSSADIGNDKL